MNYKLFLGLTIVVSMVSGVGTLFATAPVVDINQMNQPSANHANVNSQFTQTDPGSAPIVADAAVETATNSATRVALPSQSPLTLDQRLLRLQQQMQNLISMNLPQQISELQQSVAQLRGQLDVQARDLKLLNDQQRSFYQDLDQQIKQLKNLNANGDNNSNDKPNTINPTANNIQLKDANAYHIAFSFLVKKQYAKSQAAFQRYLNDYSHGQYVGNAHYWLGEIYLTQKNNTQAAKEFQIVISKFPHSNKLADAKLKLAILHAAMGKTKQARSELIQLKKQYPGSTAAQLASIRLQQLEAMDNHMSSGQTENP